MEKKFLEYLKRWSLNDHTLAFFRICLGGIIFVDLICRSFDLSYFYTDAGVLPREFLLKDHLNIDRISLHLLGGSLSTQIALFTLNAVFAGMLILGWRSRFASVLCWFFLMGIQNRNPLAMHGGDDVLRMIAFWAMFLPLGRAYSMDAANKPFPQHESNPWSVWLHFIASIAIRSQVVIIYWFLVVLRNHPEWLSEGSAVYFAMQLDQFITPLGHMFRDFLDQHLYLVKYLSWSVMLLEAVGPVLLLFPHRVVKLIGIVLLAAMHLNFGAMMYLGVFPWIDIVSLTIFLDRQHAKWILKKIENSLQRFKIGNRHQTSLNQLSETPRCQRIKNTGLAFSVLFLVFSFWYVLAINFCQLPYVKSCVFQPSFKTFGQSFYLQQYWTMFSPFPLKDDGYYEMPGVLRNDEKVDVYLGTDSASDELKPKFIAHTFRGDRHRKFMMNLWLKRNKEARLPYGRYLCTTWNDRFKGQSEKQLKTFRIIFHKESPKFGEEPSIEPVQIWEHRCFD